MKKCCAIAKEESIFLGHSQQKTGMGMRIGREEEEKDDDDDDDDDDMMMIVKRKEKEKKKEKRPLAK